MSTLDEPGLALIRRQGGNTTTLELEPHGRFEFLAGQLLIDDDPVATGMAEVVTFIIDNGTSDITTGAKGDLYFPYAATITQWTLLANTTGSIVIDLWLDVFANFPPTDADSITAAALPTIDGATSGQSSTLTGWTTAIPAGSVMRVNVDSVTDIDRVTVLLTIERSF